MIVTNRHKTILNRFCIHFLISHYKKNNRPQKKTLSIPFSLEFYIPDINDTSYEFSYAHHELRYEGESSKYTMLCLNSQFPALKHISEKDKSYVRDEEIVG